MLMAFLRTTHKAKIMGGVVSGFPLILKNDYNVHWMSLTYFLDLMGGGLSVGTLKTYAQHITDFISQLEVDGVAIDEVSDTWLIAYKKDILKRKTNGGGSNTENYAVQVLRSVINFMHWLEENRYIRGVIGVGKLYKVRIVETSKGIKHFLTKDKSKDKRKFVAPRSEWIEIIKQYGPVREDLSTRFELMIDWGQTLGLRAFETCNLTIDLLPLLETAVKAILNKKNVYIELKVTKGGRPAKIPVSPLLIKKTWEYINGDRSVVIDKCRKKAKKDYSVYQEPDYIFLSDKTGGGMCPRSYSNSIRSAFLAAVENGDLTDDERVWAHGLRHNFTVTYLRNLDRNDVKRPEAIARQVTRHGSEDAMEPYLMDRFNEDFDG